MRRPRPASLNGNGSGSGPGTGTFPRHRAEEPTPAPDEPLCGMYDEAQDPTPERARVARWMTGGDRAARERAFQAMLTMKKLDIAAMEKAFRGE